MSNPRANRVKQCSYVKDKALLDLWFCSSGDGQQGNKNKITGLLTGRGKSHLNC